jgi:FkbM family methyltransferase
MARKGVPGAFVVSGTGASYEDEDGIRHVYDFAKFGAAGNIDSGGTTEALTRRALIKLLPENSVFYDIGAHQGLYSMFVMRRRPDVEVHSFEPQSDHLLESLELNRLPNVNVHTVAVGDKEGIIGMTVSQRSSNHVVTDGEKAEISVPIVRLDAYCSARHVAAPDVIKIDIEGLEFQALRGARELLKASTPLIIAEINHCFHRYQDDFRAAMRELAPAGYGIFANDNGAFQPTHCHQATMTITGLFQIVGAGR